MKLPKPRTIHSDPRLLVETASRGLDLDLDFRARSMAELIQGGMSVSKAAEETGVPKRLLMEPGTFRDIVESTVQGYHLNSAVRRELVRSGANRFAVEALEDGDRKGFLEAAKMIADDPETGLKAEPVPIISIDLGSIASLLNDVKPLPGISFEGDE